MQQVSNYYFSRLVERFKIGDTYIKLASKNNEFFYNV